MGELYKGFTIQELKRLALGKLQRGTGESASRDEDATLGSLGSDDTKQLSNALDRDLPIAPVLALHNDACAAADKLKVYATISLTSPTLLYGIALPAVGLPYKEFKVWPVDL
jgi:hypothetical protein